MYSLPLRYAAIFILFVTLTCPSVLGQSDTGKVLVAGIRSGTHFGTELSGMDVEFRAEFFNLPNHPQFGPPDLDFSSSTFGQIFSTARGTTERVIQFGLKLSF